VTGIAAIAYEPTVFCRTSTDAEQFGDALDLGDCFRLTGKPSINRIRKGLPTIRKLSRLAARNGTPTGHFYGKRVSCACGTSVALQSELEITEWLATGVTTFRTRAKMPDDLASSHRSSQRRQFIEYFACIGLSSSLLPGVLWARLQEQKTQKITREMLREAEELTGLHFTDAQRDIMLNGVNENLGMYQELRQVHLDSTVSPALRFSPILPGMRFDTARRPFRMSTAGTPSRPPNVESLAFWPVTDLSALIRSRQLSSLELTELYLDRLKRFDPVLKCVVILTDDLALKQAKQADAEIKASRDRGPLHGIPWGVKDLIAKRGYPTTWGAPPFKDQVIPTDATVVERLEKAGAVLVAKLATGELAHDDVWFGDQTKNPWDITEGSGGSSARGRAQQPQQSGRLRHRHGNGRFHHRSSDSLRSHCPAPNAQLIRQDPDHIGNLCRTSQTVPAIEYVQASRIWTLLMEAMAQIMTDLDVYVAPQSRIDDPFVSNNLNLWLTNLTGHPAAVVPNGFARGGKPTGITFIGNLYDEGKLLALAKAYQDATGFHKKHPLTFGGEGPS